jgi:hypothetical protein
VTSLNGYLDSVCARLRVNPAEAEDIREELRSHLEELIRTYTDEGMGRAEATDTALSCFGDGLKLRECLDRVHQGDAWWMLRLKGMGVGMLIGAFLAVSVPAGGHMEFMARLFALPAAIDPSRAQIVANGLLVGGIVGLLSAGGRGLLAGWCAGSLIWLGEYVVHWVSCVAARSADPAANMLNSVLLAPLLGGVFGAAVGAASAAILSAASRIRPQIQ